MALTLKPGSRLFGAACTTELIVVKAPAHAADVRIGGHPAVADAGERDDTLVVTTSPEAKALMGKRYVDADGDLELLCTKAGDGAAAVGDTLLALKDAKPLPASD